jgi:hypothetical protein
VSQVCAIARLLPLPLLLLLPDKLSNEEEAALVDLECPPAAPSRADTGKQPLPAVAGTEKSELAAKS